jgi:hypothetical protein
VPEWPSLDEEQRRLTDRVEAGEFETVGELEESSVLQDTTGTKSPQIEGVDSNKNDPAQQHKDAETAAEL